jgi:hypothetical protein
MRITDSSRTLRHVRKVPNPEVGGENANVARLSLAVVLDRPSSECFDGQRKLVSFAFHDRTVWLPLKQNELAEDHRAMAATALSTSAAAAGP